MNIGELFVELVLAGLLALAALLFPAYSMGLLGLELSTNALAIATSLSFALGVIVDRSADTILDKWLGLVRLEFAEKTNIKEQRKALVGNDPVRDVFPEDWLRILMLAQGGDAMVRAMEALRTRIRVARNMIVLTPMLTVSVILGDWPPHSEAPHPNRLSAEEAAALFPLVELAALVVAVLVGSAWLKAPHTSRPDERGLERSWLASAATAWLGLHFLAAAAIIMCSPDWTTASVAAAGLVLAILSALAWKRMTMSFTDFLWKYGRFTDAKGLSAHIRDPAGHA